MGNLVAPIEGVNAWLDQGARTVVRRQWCVKCQWRTPGILADIDAPESYRRIIGKTEQDADERDCTQAGAIRASQRPTFGIGYCG